jgi:hypothetical protein
MESFHLILIVYSAHLPRTCYEKKEITNCCMGPGVCSMYRPVGLAGQGPHCSIPLAENMRIGCV